MIHQQCLGDTMLKLVIPAMLALLAGCAAKGPKLVPVSGKLTFDGAPLAHKTIQFIPEPGTPGSGAGATSTATGDYSLIATKGGSLVDCMGACPGRYKVVVVEPMFPVDADLKVPVEGEQPAPAIGLPGTPSRKRERQSIPPAYGNALYTPLVVTVPETGGDISLELKAGR